MIRLIRAVLVWLLVLALPAQGAAAATLASCSPNHLVAPNAAAPHQVAVTDPGQRMQHRGHQHAAEPDLAPHGHAAQQASGEDGPALSRASPDTWADAESAAGELPATKLGHADKHKCSACASCCCAALTCSTVLKVPAPVVTPTVFIAVVPMVEPFSSDGPDRPPRVRFA